MRTAVGWGVREGFLEELPGAPWWIIQVARTARANTSWWKSLAGSRDRRETTMAGAVRETEYILWGPT